MGLSSNGTAVIESIMDGTALYLDLLKKCLTHYLWQETMQPIDPVQLRYRWLGTWFCRRLAARQIYLSRRVRFDAEMRRNGCDWPQVADTMIGLKRLDNLQHCIESVLRDQVPGDLIETGVWRGGATIFMRAVLKAHEVVDRIVWVADSFEGLPVPDAEKYPQDSGDTHHTHDRLRISMEDVQANFAKYGLLDGGVRFLKGWFKDTLPTAPIDRLAVMRLDGDMYSSTMDALNNLYPKLSIGGYAIIDDYGYWEPCRQAVHDYREAHQITDPIHEVDWTGVYWRRTK
jgi:O-methyltransferase